MNLYEENDTPWSYWLNNNLKFTEYELVEFFIKRDGLNLPKNQSKSTVAKRYFLYNILYYSKEKVYTLQEIGKMFNRKHTTVLNGLEKWRRDKNLPLIKIYVLEYEKAFKLKSPYIRENDN